jgi:hypothetical protein
LFINNVKLQLQETTEKKTPSRFRKVGSSDQLKDSIDDKQEGIKKKIQWRVRRSKTPSPKEVEGSARSVVAMLQVLHD